jgi:hypothetical protein
MPLPESRPPSRARVFIGAVETLLEKDQVLSAVAPFIKS